MDGIKKTALFLCGLEWKTVDLLLGRLDAETARAVRREMMTLGEVPTRDANRLANEFLREAGVERRPPNREVEHQLKSSGTYGRPGFHAASETASEPRFPVESFVTEKSQTTKPFEFLYRLNEKIIAKEIAQEHPQTITVVLAHLPTSLAGKVLGSLSEQLQVEIGRRLSEFEPMDPTILHEIEAVFKERFERREKSKSRHDRGAAAIQEILKSSDPATRRRVLSNLSDDDAMSENTTDNYQNDQTLNTLAKLGDEEFSILFRSVDLKTGMLALTGARADLIRRFTAQLTPTEEHEIRLKLKQFGPIGQRDVDRARNTLLKKAELLLS